MRKIAVTDIHGCHLTFKKLIQDIVQLSLEDELYLLGDYIDRGPGSRQVFDYIFELKNAGHKVRCLRGNHEQVLLECIDGKGSFTTWLHYGGGMTLDSFNVEFPAQIMPKYLNFINELEYCIEVDNYILVHAGLNFGTLNPLENKHGMLWSRDWEHLADKEWLNGRRVVYGHTPVTKQVLEANLTRFRERLLLNIDIGCYGTYIANYGHLSAFDMTNEVLYFQENIDDMSAWINHIKK